MSTGQMLARPSRRMHSPVREFTSASQEPSALPTNSCLRHGLAARITSGSIQGRPRGCTDGSCGYQCARLDNRSPDTAAPTQGDRRCRVAMSLSQKRSLWTLPSTEGRSSLALKRQASRSRALSAGGARFDLCSIASLLVWALTGSAPAAATRPSAAGLSPGVTGKSGWHPGWHPAAQSCVAAWPPITVSVAPALPLTQAGFRRAPVFAVCDGEYVTTLSQREAERVVTYHGSA